MRKRTTRGFRSFACSSRSQPARKIRYGTSSDGLRLHVFNVSYRCSEKSLSSRKRDCGVPVGLYWQIHRVIPSQSHHRHPPHASPPILTLRIAGRSPPSSICGRRSEAIVSFYGCPLQVKDVDRWSSAGPLRWPELPLP